LLACQLFACALAFQIFSISLFSGQLEINPFAKNALSIAQKCCEIQFSMNHGQSSRQKRGVERPKL